MSEWIECDGKGACPVPAGTKVAVRFRNGVENDVCRAGDWLWGGWGGYIGEIIAYRVLEPAPEVPRLSYSVSTETSGDYEPALRDQLDAALRHVEQLSQRVHELELERDAAKESASVWKAAALGYSREADFWRGRYWDKWMNAKEVMPHAGNAGHHAVTGAAHRLLLTTYDPRDGRLGGEVGR